MNLSGMKPCRYTISTFLRPVLKSPSDVMSAVVRHPVHPVRLTQLCGHSLYKPGKLKALVVQVVPLRQNHGKCYAVVCFDQDGVEHFLNLRKDNMIRF